MHKISRIALTEYLNAVRSKAFLLGLIMLPVLMFGSVLVQKLTRNKGDIRDHRVAIFDQSGILYPVLAAKAQLRNEREIFDPTPAGKGRQIRPKFVLEEIKLSSTNGMDELGLSQRVRKKELFAFLVIPKNVLSTEFGPETEIAYSTQTPTFTELPDWLERTINNEIQQIRFKQAAVDSSLIRKLTRNASFKKLGLMEVSATGSVTKAKEENKIATFAVPAGAMFLLYMLIMSSAPALLSTVLEEKMQKISEVLVASVTPFQLMMGKLIGAVLTSMTLSGLYLSVVGGLLWKNGMSHFVPPSLILWFLLFQLLGLLIYGSVMSAMGAACTEMKDAQNMMFPVMMMIVVPMFMWMPILQSPTSNFARIISLMPPMTPLLMLLRIAIPPGPPWWEVALGVGLTTLFMLVCVWASGKIFRVGILSQGQSPTLGKVIKWVWSA